MADESLGHIDLRVISTAITGGAGGGAGGESPIKKAEKFALEPLKGVEEAFKKFGTLKDVFSSITQGGGIRGTLRAASGAAEAIGAAGAGGVGTAALVGGVAAIGVAVAGVTAIVAGISSLVSNVLSRISELARVNAAMAKENALNKLGELQRDMKEAKVLGPMYTTISTIWRSIMNGVQPIMLFIKTALMAIVIPILKLVELGVSIIATVIQWIAGILGSILSVIGQGLQTLGSMLSALSTSIPSWMDPGGILAGMANAIGTGFSTVGAGVSQVGGTLLNISQMVKQATQKQNVNAWATDTLDALAAGIGASASHGYRTRSAVP
jgi:phage-related protein